MFTTLMKRIDETGGVAAIVDAGDTTTYAQLAEGVHAWKLRLTEAGVGSGSVASLEASHSGVSASAILALIGLDAICVPMTNLPSAKRREFSELAQVEVSVRPTSGEAESADVIRHTGVTADHELYRRLRETGHPGLVLFSSGTTGRSKASVLDFEKMLERYVTRRAALRTMSFLNLDHIGGINTLLHTISQGGTVVTVRERTPDDVFGAIAEHRVEVLPTTPTFLTMTLISGAHKRHDLSTLRVITYGTEPMPQQTLERLSADLPTVTLKQTYGLSELGILATKSRSNDSLWVKLGGADFEYKVVDGVLWVRSQMAMLGYLNAQAPFDDEGYFNTQDAVEVDGEYLRILGRTSELINVAGEKVYPNEVESVLLEMDNIAEVTAAGLANQITGQVVCATIRLIEPEDVHALRRRVDRFCRDRLEAYKIPAKLVITQDTQHSDRFKKLRR